MEWILVALLASGFFFDVDPQAQVLEGGSGQPPAMTMEGGSGQPPKLQAFEGGSGQPPK